MRGTQRGTGVFALPARSRTSRRFTVVAAFLGLAAVLLPSASAGDAMIPLIDFGSNTYYGLTGGLYENGSSVVPDDYAAVGMAQTGMVTPLDTNGSPSSNGKIVLLSIGASAQSQEWCGKPTNCTTPLAPAFMTFAAANPAVNHTSLVIVNGAESGKYIRLWGDPIDRSNKTYGLVNRYKLAPLGLTEAQVQVIWLEDADSGPTSSLPAATADAYTLEARLADAVRAIHVRYPNARAVFVSSRIYAGYALTTQNPEPYAYESGFAVKWLVQAEINQLRAGTIDPVAGDLSPAVAPWVAWGAYTWANGTSPRSDGITWLRTDFTADGTHPSGQGRAEFAQMTMNFFLNSTFAACWFLASSPGCTSAMPYALPLRSAFR